MRPVVLTPFLFILNSSRLINDQVGFQNSLLNPELPNGNCNADDSTNSLCADALAIYAQLTTAANGVKTCTLTSTNFELIYDDVDSFATDLKDELDQCANMAVCRVTSTQNCPSDDSSTADSPSASPSASPTGVEGGCVYDCETSDFICHGFCDIVYGTGKKSG